jgi:hypothetical protein
MLERATPTAARRTSPSGWRTWWCRLRGRARRLIQPAREAGGPAIGNDYRKAPRFDPAPGPAPFRGTTGANVGTTPSAPRSPPRGPSANPVRLCQFSASSGHLAGPAAFAEQVSERDSVGSRARNQTRQGRVGLPQLQSPKVLRAQVGALRRSFLRQAGVASQLSKASAKGPLCALKCSSERRIHAHFRAPMIGRRRAFRSHGRRGPQGTFASQDS